MDRQNSNQYPGMFGNAGRLEIDINESEITTILHEQF